MEIVEEGKKLLTISEGGKGRRSEFSDYSLQGRGGKGILNYKTDRVAGIKAVADDDDIIAISSDGIIIRLSVAEVNVQQRGASGVKVMRLANEDSRVVSFTVAPKGDEDEEEGEISESEAPETETAEVTE